MTRQLVGAVDWGGTWIRVGVADLAGRVLRQSTLRRPEALHPQIELIGRTTADLAAQNDGTLAAVAIAIAGVIRDGIVASAGNIGITTPFDIAADVQGRLGVPVSVINDSQAAAVVIAADAPGTTAVLTLGTGLGGAVITDGSVVGGRGAAGDFGHVVVVPGGDLCACGGRGCLEQAVSGRVLDVAAQRLAESGDSPVLTDLRRSGRRVAAADLGIAAEAGETVAAEVLTRAAKYLAAGIRTVVAAVDPHRVVLAGHLVADGSFFARLVVAEWELQRPRWPVADLTFAAHPEDAGLAGAARLAASGATAR